MMWKSNKSIRVRMQLSKLLVIIFIISMRTWVGFGKVLQRIQKLQPQRI